MYYSDSPIKQDKDDLLNRSGFSKLLAKTLINLKPIDTYTVGLFGKWGSGKTSLVNMMLQEIQQNSNDENEFIIVRFEPWNFSDTNQLISQFLIHLANEFKNKKDKSLSKVGKALEKYSSLFDVFEVIPYAGKSISSIFKSLASIFGKRFQKEIDEKDILKQKEYIINLLSKQQHKILVIIDDIDRLNDTQIRQIFQLITAVAKFPNTIYLAVFDKDVVIKALEKEQNGKGNEYLEKIIQMPIEIPEVPTSTIRKILFKRLDDLITENKNIQFSSDNWQTLFQPCIAPFIKNIRVINRLINSLTFKFSAVLSEVDFADMVAITLLEICMPSIYNWVKDNKATLTGYDPWNAQGLKDKKKDECFAICQHRIKNAVQASENRLMTEDELTLVINFLSKLFPIFANTIGKSYISVDKDELRRYNRIGHTEKFDRYFILDLESVGLKSSLINDVVLNYSSKEIGDVLLNLSKNDNCYELLCEVKSRLKQILSDRAKIITTAILKLLYQLDQKPNGELGLSNTQFVAEDLIYKLIEKINTDERSLFLTNSLENADIDSLPALATIIKMVELGYGRMSANGKEHHFQQIVSLEDLLIIEKCFCNKTKKLLEVYALWDFERWAVILSLLEWIDSDFTNKYLTQELKHNENVLKFISLFIKKWSGGEISYEVDFSKETRITSERVLEAINTEKNNGNLFLLPQRVQCNSAAFYLYSEGKFSYDNHIFETAIIELLHSWKDGEI